STASDNRATPFQALHRDWPGVGAGVLKNDVSAFAVCNLSNLVKNVLLLTIQDEACPELMTELKLVVAGGNCDDIRVVKLGGLDPHSAEPAGCSPDKNEITSPYLGSGDQHAPHCYQDQGNGRRLFES